MPFGNCNINASALAIAFLIPRIQSMCIGHISDRDLNELDKQGLLFGHEIGKLDFCENCVFGKQRLDEI